MESDQVAYWKAEIRRREQWLNECQSALHRKRITAAFGHTAADSEELLQVRKAQARREQAEKMMKVIKQWVLVVEQEVIEYRGPTQQLNNVLDADVPRALSSLSRMHQILESYLAVTPIDSAASLGAAVSDAAATAFAPSVASTPATGTAASRNVASAVPEGLDTTQPEADGSEGLEPGIAPDRDGASP